MATVDQVAGIEEVPVAPQPAAPPPPPPPPGSQPVVGADGRPTQRTTRRTVKRRPIPRGTAAISGGAVAGTLLTVIYAAAGPIALVATAAGAVAIPLVVWRRRSASRTGRRATARRGARRQSRGNFGGWSGPGGRSSRRGGGLGLGNPLAGLGGGGGRKGSRSTGRSLFGAGAGRGRKGGNPLAGLGLGGGKNKNKGKGSATGAASGGLSAKSKSRRNADGSRTVGGRGGRSRQVTPKGPRGAGSRHTGGRVPKAHTRGGATGGGWKPPKGAGTPKGSTPKGNTPKGGSTPKGSTPKTSSRGAAGGWTPPKPATGGSSTSKAPKPAAATASGGTTQPPKVKKVTKRNQGGYGPRGRGGQYGPWQPPRRVTRRGRVASALNHGVWRAGSAFLHGVRKPTGKRAFRSAYRRYGAQGYSPTVTGFLGRVAGGVAAAIPASLARLAWTVAKKVRKSVRQAYNPPRPAQQTQQTQQPAQTQQQQTQQHPVPNPAFAGPTPTPSPRPDGSRPSPRPRQSAAAGSGTSSGGPSNMSTLFPPHAHASDFYSRCSNWSPVADGTDRAIWKLYDALPYMAGSVGHVANGWVLMAGNIETGLQGALHASMKQALVDVWKPLNAANQAAAQLLPTFTRVYADAIARRGVRGGQALNV
jgi:hypothetical protein